MHSKDIDQSKIAFKVIKLYVKIAHSIHHTCVNMSYMLITQKISIFLKIFRWISSITTLSVHIGQ